MTKLTHLDLFSGIGGMSIAAEWAGFETVGFCEIADFPTKVLEKHWPDVPRWRDIRTLTKEDFCARTGLRTVDIVSGGFPCQPFSVAGKQKGKADNRFLWPEALRVIREIKPRYVLLENVPGIINIAADDVCADLEHAGYMVGVLDFEAAAVGAPHRRERIAFVGYAEHTGSPAAAQPGSVGTAETGSAQGAVTSGKLTGAGGRGDGGAMGDAERGGLHGIDGRRAGAELAHGCTDVPDATGGEDRRIREQGVRSDAGASSDDVSDAPEPRLPYRDACQTGQSGQTAQSERRNGVVSDTNECTKGHDGTSIRPAVYTIRKSGSGDLHGGDGRDGTRHALRPVESGLGCKDDGVPRWLPGPINPWLDGSWDSIPRVGRKIPDRVNKLKALGNAIVPQQFYPIFKAIWETEAESNAKCNMWAKH